MYTCTHTYQFKQAAWLLGAANTVFPAHVQEPSFIAGHGSWQRMLHWRTDSAVRRSTRSVDMIVSVSAVIGLVTAFVGDTGLRTLSEYQVWNSGLSISRPGDLDLETAAHYCSWNVHAIVLPILVFLGRFILDLSANTYQTRHVTLRPWPLMSLCWSLMRVFVLHLCTNFETLKFVGLPVRKILGIYCVSINRPGDLDL